jgi:hypothetical protein
MFRNMSNTAPSKLKLFKGKIVTTVTEDLKKTVDKKLCYNVPWQDGYSLSKYKRKWETTHTLDGQS